MIWEYTTLFLVIGEKIDPELNKYGLARWELVGVTTDVYGHLFVFKRPKEWLGVGG